MKRWIVIVLAAVLILAACNSGEPQVDKPAASAEPARSASPADTPCEGGAEHAPNISAENDRSPAETDTPAAPEEKGDKKDPAEEVRELTEKLLEELGEGYRSGIEGLFIVLGNISEREFRRIMRHTIRACSQRMYTQYFEKKPDYVIKIYLFGDATSYEQMAKKLWNDTNLSPFGYFKPDKKALVMNIGTGTGTLVHEMFHALVEPDFPDIPTWVNEGIASLYECCLVKDDGLYGMINWRFPRLKKAVEENKLVPLKELVATTTRQFYGRGSDLHYAQARYFCMYLQEKGLLPKFYKKFRDNYEDDPTGKKFLEELLGKEIDEIEKDWLKWVKTLKYER